MTTALLLWVGFTAGVFAMAGAAAWVRRAQRLELDRRDPRAIEHQRIYRAR